VSPVALEDLLKLAHAACEAALRAGADFADASVERGRSMSVAAEQNAIKSSDTRAWASISVRAFAEGATGWASASGTTLTAARRAGRRAAELARAAEADPEFIDLVRPARYPSVEGLFDPRLTTVNAGEVAGWITGNIDTARQVADDALVSGTARASWWEWALVNSLGVAVAQPGTRASVSLQVMIRRGEDIGTYYEWDAARSLAQFAPEQVGALAAGEALRYLDSRTMKTATLPAVLGPMAASAFLGGVCLAASAEEVQRNRSFLVGRKGERIAAEGLTLVDDPLSAGGLSSEVSDGDGFPHARVTLVENGVLQTYLHSHYTAQKSGEANTGHATRNGIACTNIVPALGVKSAAQMIAEVSDGIYVTLARPEPDIASGQVSALVDAGFRIKNGQLTYPLKNTMVAGHAPEMLLHLDAVSSDYRAEPGRLLPTLRLQNLRVASGE
jgi:PmbA protein